MMTPNTLRKMATRGAALLTVAFALTGLTASGARAQMAPPPTGPALVFPVIVGDKPDSAKLVDEVVTEALRNAFAKYQVNVVIYNKRMPSIQRAAADTVLAKADVDAGPGDDRRKAQVFAEVVGASEYLTVFVDDYKYDAKSRTATFQLSVSRYSADGTALGTVAKPQQGMAPADVIPTRQEGSAIARAAEVGAKQALQTLYPDSAMRMEAPVESKPKSRKDRLTIPIFGAALGVLFFSTR